MLRSFPSFLCLAALTLATAGCRAPTSKIPVDQLGEQTPAQAEDEKPSGEAPLPVERAADLLPPDVPVVAEASAPALLLGSPPPPERYPAFATFRSELRSQLGADPFDAQQWDALGLDNQAPAGVGVLDLAVRGWFAYLSLSNEELFEQTLRRAAAMLLPDEEPSVMSVGDARIHRISRKASVVVREQVALLIVVDTPELATRDYVATAATIDPRESLGHSERFLWARAQLRPEDDGMLYVSPTELVAQAARSSRSHTNTLRRQEAELARGRAAGLPPEQLQELELRVEELRRWQRQREALEAAKHELANRVFGPIQAIVGGADLRSEGVVAHGRALIPSHGSLLRRMFVTPEHESPLLSALAEPPLFVLDGGIEPQVLVELADQLARSEGQRLDEINRRILTQLGVDLLGTVVPALGREAGFALTQTTKPDPTRLDAVPKTLGVAGHLQLRDPDVIRDLFDGIARDARLGNTLRRSKRGHGWVFEVRHWREVELSIVGERLILTSEPGLAARIRDAERGAAAESFTPEHPLRGPLLNPAMRTYGRFVGMALTDVHEPWLESAESMLYGIDAHHSLSPEEAAAVPHTNDYRRKLAELEEAVDELNAYNLRRAQRHFERELAAAEQWGDFGWQLEPRDDGFELAAQWRFASPTTPLELGLLWSSLATTDDDWHEYERVHHRCLDIIAALRMIRQAELDAAAANEPKP